MRESVIYQDILQQGIERGIKQGIEQAIEQGIKQGIEQAIEQIALNMLRQELDFELIQKITNLSLEQLQNLKKIVTQEQNN
jgi:predicted transposase/invertase (TIGR01784 family)